MIKFLFLSLLAFTPDGVFSSRQFCVQQLQHKVELPLSECPTRRSRADFPL